MRTEFHHQLEEQIRKDFENETNGFDLPPLSALSRKKVMARRKTEQPVLYMAGRLLDLLRMPVKVYHLGLTLLVISVGIFYLNEGSYEQVNNSSFIDGGSGLAITNTTISVNSSTMLTSIPTLVIRN